MAADDDVGTGVGERLRPATLVGVGLGGVLIAPVRAGHDEVGPGRARRGDVGGHELGVHHAHRPGLRQRDAVQVRGVVEHGDQMARALDDRRLAGRLLAVSDARDEHVRMRRAPVGELGRYAVQAAVERMVVGVEHHVKARGDLGVADLLRAVEAGIARKAERLAAQKRLLAHEREVRRLHVPRDVRKEVGVVPGAVRAQAAVLHARVQEHVADRHDRKGAGHGGGLFRAVIDRHGLALRLRCGHVVAARQHSQPRKCGSREERAAREHHAGHGVSLRRVGVTPLSHVLLAWRDGSRTVRLP